MGSFDRPSMWVVGWGWGWGMGRDEGGEEGGLNRLKGT